MEPDPCAGGEGVVTAYMDFYFWNVLHYWRNGYTRTDKLKPVSNVAFGHWAYNMWECGQLQRWCVAEMLFRPFCHHFVTYGAWCRSIYLSTCDLTVLSTRDTLNGTKNLLALGLNISNSPVAKTASSGRRDIFQTPVLSTVRDRCLLYLC